MNQSGALFCKKPPVHGCLEDSRPVVALRRAAVPTPEALEPARITGYGTADVGGYTYDSTRGNLLPLTRTDPLAGATAFGYDPLNRRTSVTDPNNVQTVTAYDNLDRVTSVTRKGAAAAEDLVTAYAYNTFGDLFRTTLPRGNLIEYGYDAAGRLTSIERRPDATNHGERIFYTLDAYGHRTKEELQSWNGTAWATQSSTSYVYSSRCHLDKAVYPYGSATEYGYDCDGNLAQVWDANHPKATNPTPTQTYAYDSLNRLSSVTQPWGGAGGRHRRDRLRLRRPGSPEPRHRCRGERHLLRLRRPRSDDLQVSPASGTTAYAYNEHGELTSRIDARGIVMSRAVDALDRATGVNFPTSELAATYTYEDPAVPFSNGRLTRISRGASVIDYRYDRFGRLTQDGELAYGYDANGNPSSLVYPGGMTAVTTYDFADRPATLTAQRTGKPDQAIVTASSYLPSGSLKSLTLGNGLVENHAYSQRYFPSSITLGGLLSWTYTTDKTGNISGIADALSAANNRTYGYQDHQYFLTQGNGPWGTRAWTYDRIGNRLTETRGGITDTYTYQLVPAPGTGHSPILSTIQLGAGGSRSYQYDPAGNLQQIAQGSTATLFTNDDAGRLAALSTTSPPAGTSFRYDGRDYLTLADTAALPFLNGFESGDACGWSAALGLPVVPTCAPLPAVHPTYSSEGLLHALQRATTPQRSYILYFAGRPVAQMDLTGTTESWKFLTVDHLGTPIAATSTGGALLWKGGFEPFGADWSGAGGAGVFLRFPGQWEEGAWGSLGTSLYYNLNRWYGTPTGRYVKPDPIGLQGGINAYLYAEANPTRNIDPFGLSTLGTSGKVCTDCSCQKRGSSIPVLIKPETGSGLIPIAPAGQCINADGVYGPKGIIKLTDLATCWIECDETGSHGNVRCNMAPPWPTFFPCKPGAPRKPGRDWPNNPFCN